MMGFFARYGKRLGILTLAALLVVGAALVAAAAEPSTGTEETRKALWDLRKSHFQRLRADERALIERAISEGKITREQADRMLKK